MFGHPGERVQQRGFTRTRPSHDEQVPVVGGTIGTHAVPLTIGFIEQPETVARCHGLPGGGGLQVGHMQVDIGHPRRERIEPRTTRGACAGHRQRGRGNARNVEIPGCGHLAEHRRARLGGDHAPAGLIRRQRGRGIRADHSLAVGAVVHAQRQSQAAVRQQRVTHHAGRPLRAQNQVDAERPSPGGDVDKESVQLRKHSEHGRELIDDDDKPGKRMLQPHVGHVPRSGLAQHALTVAKFGPQTGQGPRGRVRIEVGDEADAVRQPTEWLKGSAAFEIDEQKVHLAG